MNKIELRESLNIPISENATSAEVFQNQTLRPILKLQNDLYMSLFMNYAKRQNSDFDSLSQSKKNSFIEQSIQKDNGLKNTFIGITIGMFTLEELEEYQSDSKVFNKSIITMIVERIQIQTNYNLSL